MMMSLASPFLLPLEQQQMRILARARRLMFEVALRIGVSKQKLHLDQSDLKWQAAKHWLKKNACQGHLMKNKELF